MKIFSTFHAVNPVLIGFSMAWFPLLAAAQTDSGMMNHDMHTMPKPSSADRRQSTPEPSAAARPAATSGANKPSMEAMPGMKHDAMPGMHEEHTAPPPSSKRINADATGDKPLAPHALHGAKPDPSEVTSNASESSMPGMDHRAMSGMNMGANPEMRMGPMQGGSPPPDARDPDAYAEGHVRHDMRGMEMADDASFGHVIINDLEYVKTDDATSQRINAEAWYGGDVNKAWFKVEGDRSDGRWDSSSSELLWDRVFATFWSTQLGLRHDTGPVNTRNWLAVGVRGLAPYWFETEAAVYLDEEGRLASRVEVSYELLLTRRLILQPSLEANIYSRNDEAYHEGAGFANLDLGLRLRYEIRRQFAPYIGIQWTNRFGQTADYARLAGEDPHETEYVVGVRLWF